MTSGSGEKTQYLVISSYLELLVVQEESANNNTNTIYTVKRFANTVLNMLEPSSSHLSPSFAHPISFPILTNTQMLAGV